jgi:zinc protease
MLNRINPPAFHPIESVNIISPESLKLSNGSNLFMFNAGEQELIRIQWVFENAAFQANQPIINSALSALLLEGTTKYSSAHIAEKVDFYGAYLFSEYSYDQTTLNLVTLTKYLDKLLPFVLEVLNDAIFPQQELDTYKRNSKQSLKISLEKNDYLARRQFNNVLFGNSNYGYIQEESDFDKLNSDDLKTLFKQQIVPANCTIFVSGKISAETLNYISNTINSGWTGSTDAISFPNHEFEAVPTQKIVIEREKAIQSAIRIGQLSIPRSHPDFPSLQVLNTTLGGYFGSRLMMNIREDKGYTYGIGSGIGSLKHAAFFTISSEVGTAVCANTLKEIEFEINRLRTEKISEEELTLVKNYLLGSMLGSLEGVFSHTDKFKQAYFSGLTLDYFDYYTQQVKDITSEDLLAMADKYLNFHTMVQVVVGKV